MIVSASYNDDIPAFYGRWFMTRLDAGYCRTFDTQGLRMHRVALTREAVDGFVFFTRDATRFTAALREIHTRGFPFVVHYGSTKVDAVESMRRLSATYGVRSLVWRYEPLTAATEAAEWHLANFDVLAAALEGSTDEVIVSLDSASAPADSRPLLKALAAIAGSRGMRFSVCSEPDSLVPGAGPARCIDARRLSAMAARKLDEPTAARWPGCLCAMARDIGTPLEGPARGAALALRDEAHDPDGEFLVPPPTIAASGPADLPF